MKRKIFTRWIVLIVVGLGFLEPKLYSQDLTPWTSNPYGNEWIQDLNKKYVRLTVARDGLARITAANLSTFFPGTPIANLQLWYRGKEIPMSVSGSDLLFFGRKNDGAGEGYLYRPGPEARLNPYVNILSDLGYYFLTTVDVVTSDSPKRIPTINGGVAPGGLTAEPYHLAKDLYTFANQFSFTTYSPNEEQNDAYYTAENSWTGPSFFGAGTGATGTQLYRDVDILLKNWVKTGPTPKLNAMVNGTNPGLHQINFYAGPTTDTRENTNIITIPDFYNFTGQFGNATLGNSFFTEPGQSFAQSYMRLKTLTTNNVNDYCALTYYILTYGQSIDMGARTAIPAGTGTTAITAVAAQTSAYFNFDPTPQSTSYVSILNAPANAVVYDVTDQDAPKVLTSSRTGTTINVLAPRTADKALRLFVINPAIATAAANYTTVNFKPLYANSGGDETIPTVVNPSAYDYLIITHNVNKTAGNPPYPEFVASSQEYAKYRSSEAGGAYNTLMVNIRDIYDQFNFGEPSPLAIRRFVKYMLQNGIRDKHNLLLMGFSVTYSGNIVKELRGEVPTFGDPSSDLLLVAGLQPPPNVNEDVPAIPVGRINAYTSTEIDNYLTKVKYYEAETELTWRRSIVQMVGGADAGQVNTFTGFFNFVNTNYTNDVVAKDVKPLKTNGATGGLEAKDIDEETKGWINSGAGLISYYGHGNQVNTSLWIQDISKADDSSLPWYGDNKKYPLLYFLGCGVGNNSFRRTGQYFAANWMMQYPDKGAIAVMANSWITFIPQAYDHMKKTYEELFSVSDSHRATIGQILRDVALRSIPTMPGGRVMADRTTTGMIHSMNLLGDPAITLLKSNDGSLPVDLFGFTAKLYEGTKVKLDWKTSWEKNNSHFIVERSYNAKTFEKIGYVEGNGDKTEESSYEFIDKNPGPGINYYRIKSVDLAPTSAKGNDYSKIVSIAIPNTDQFVVFPNPTVDQFSMKLNVPANFKSWTLTDVSGKTVMSGEKSDASMGKLASGVYILEVRTAQGDVYKEKIVKK